MSSYQLVWMVQKSFTTRIVLCLPVMPMNAQLSGIGMARELIGPHAVSALMTTTKDSLNQPESIVDEYVKQEFKEIFIRPLSPYGFARRNTRIIGYTLNEFLWFYERALKRVLEWNNRGVEIREVTATILLNKILSPFDGGYVDLQSPTGAGRAVLAYNYDGFVYPSDEARMVAESGDFSLRLGTNWRTARKPL